MNIIVGATGQIGSNIISEIIKKGFPVRAVARNPEKISDNNIEICKVDLLNSEQVIQAFKGGTTAFVLTPENPSSNDIIGETKQIVDNYNKALRAAGIRKVIALSCVGAHIEGNTGNVLMSRILERGLDNLDIEKVIVRPSYYFSNWLGYVDTINENGILPTFFPQDFKLDMNSPIDLAKFIANIMISKSISKNKLVYELVGPHKYSSNEVANTFSKLLNKEIIAQSIPQENWKEILMSFGFTENTAMNLIDMTQAVIDNRVVPERPDDVVRLETTFDDYIMTQMGG